MTDFQFKGLMAMVLDILDNKDLEEAKKTIARLAGELAKPQKTKPPKLNPAKEQEK